jgi:hypothetical protein
MTINVTPTPADLEHADKILEEMRGGPLVLCSPDRSRDIIARHLAVLRSLFSRDLQTMTRALREALGLPGEPAPSAPPPETEAMARAVDGLAARLRAGAFSSMKLDEDTTGITLRASFTSLRKG